MRELPYNNFCCEEMIAHVYIVDLDKVLDDEDKEDKVIHYLSKYDEYGIPIFDGSSSYIQIEHCPWCGKKLPNSKRELWLSTLMEMGIDPVEDVPYEFNNSTWWMKK